MGKVRCINLCLCSNIGYICSGNTNLYKRKECKYFPATLDECPDFNCNGYKECNCLSAQFEAWALLKKPE